MNELVNSNSYKKDLFFKKFIFNEIENEFFKQLQKILEKNNTSKIYKQKNIEKLVNIYLLNKTEKKININPFWKEKIHNIFQKEFSLFSINYKNILLNLKTKDSNALFYKHDLKIENLFSPDEVFILFILNYIENIEKIHDEKKMNDYFLLESTFLDTISNKFLDYFKSKFLIEALELFLKEENKKNNINIDELSFSYIRAELENWSDKKYFIDYKIILVYYLKKRFNNEKLDNRFKIVREYDTNFLNFYNKLVRDNIYFYIIKFCKHVEDFFLENQFFKRIYVKNTGSKKTYTYLEFFDLKYFNKIDFIYHISSQLPMIVEPQKWNYNGKNGGYLLRSTTDFTLDKKIKKGFSSFNFSKKTIDIINLLQQKKYKINLNFLSFCQTDWFKESFQILNSWEDIFHNEFYVYYFFKENFQNKLKDLNLFDNVGLYLKDLISLKSSIIYRNGDFEQKQQLKQKLLLDYQMTSDIIDGYYNLLEKERSFLKSLNLYKEYSFLMKITNLFKDEDIYNVTKLDFRGRFYPVGRLLHRATGKYKFLLNIENSYSLTENDFSLIKENIGFLLYNKKDNFKREDLLLFFNKNFDFKNFEIDSNNVFVFKKLFNFIKELMIDNEFQKSPKFNKYFIPLKHEQEIKYMKFLYEKIKNDKENRHILLMLFYNYFGFLYLKDNFETNFCIELDQSSSGPQLYGLLSQDLNLCESTNIIELDNKKRDIYIDFLNIFYKNFESFINDFLRDQEDPKFIDELLYIDKKKEIIFSRNNFSKLIIMPKFYNMGDKGLRKLLYSLNFNIQDNLNKKLFIDKLIFLINNVLDLNYLKTINYQKYLVEIANVLKKNNWLINLQTIDGSIISYKYITIKETFGKIYKNKKAISYRLFLPINEYSTELSGLHSSTFPPNFIHSLDGAICRLIVYIFFVKLNYILEPLHDSFRLPIVYFESLKNVVKYIYSFIFFNEYFLKNKLYLKVKNKKIYLDFNNENYIEYSNFFIKEFEYDDDILNNSFISKILLNENSSFEIAEKFKKLKIEFPKTFDEDIFKKFLNNNFMFYF